MNIKTRISNSTEKEQNIPDPNGLGNWGSKMFKLYYDHSDTITYDGWKYAQNY